MSSEGWDPTPPTGQSPKASSLGQGPVRPPSQEELGVLSQAAWLPRTVQAPLPVLFSSFPCSNLTELIGPGSKLKSKYLARKTTITHICVALFGWVSASTYISFTGLLTTT